MPTISQLHQKNRRHILRRSGAAPRQLSGVSAPDNQQDNEAALLEMSQLAAEMNNLLDGMHEDTQDMIRDMRAMRSVTPA